MSSGPDLYRHAKIGDFTQTPPTFHNPYIDDPLLRRTLRRLVSQKHLDRVSKDLSQFGDRIVAEINHLGRRCELNQPRLEQHDAWGRRVDELIVCPEWNRLKEICAEEGLIAIGYDDNIDSVTRRVHQVHFFSYPLICI
ncbi:unnamed protein product [Strongylus vulgaris]|uniref:Adaptive response protein AidB N-terminal domain-containing protein n=1 Tax=Strongylus vulgaris TaxID=40348 RepID=A0A3P7IXH2_STRVU|nr:unnamed protein product [Strongylus vulgaris]